MESPLVPHPFRWYTPQRAKALIIGTFPPIESRWGYPFFYPNPRNLFWKIMSDISGLPITGNPETAITERKNILDKLRLGVTDMGGTIRRLANNSLDENLELIEHMPIFQILDENPGISRILLTSSSGKVSALAWFRVYLLQHGVNHVKPTGPRPQIFEINYHGRNIVVHVMFSPSPRAANRISYPKLVEMYRTVLEL